MLASFFHSGPFSWRGVFVFWLALFAYAAFLVVMGLVLRPANLNDLHTVDETAPRSPDLR